MYISGALLVTLPFTFFDKLYLYKFHNILFVLALDTTSYAYLIK